MRKFLTILCVMLLAAQFAAAQKNLYVVTKTGELYVYPAEKVSFSGNLPDIPSDKDSSSDVPSDKDSLQDNTNYKIINGHKFINLGLPSGLLWAETNIGAETAADDGNYYAWGETTTKDTYNWSTYKYGTSRTDITKYNSTDGKTVLDNEDDAAYVNWGSPCRMPTQTEFVELCNTDNCKWTWTSMNTSSGTSISGFKIVSKKNGNSIFLPASGCRLESYLDYHGSHGVYWGTLLSNDTSHAGCLNIYGSSLGSSYESDVYYSRCNGHPVRPVAEP